MDISAWTKLNQAVKVCDTTKKFFNKFLYKAVIYVPAGQLARNTKFDDMQFLLEERASFHGRTINYGGSWVNSGYYSSRRKSVEHARVDQLEYWRDTIKNRTKDFNFRIEEPYIAVYSDDEEELYKLVENDPSKKSLKQLFKPKNDQAAMALDRGEIYLKKQTEYNYRICFKEGKRNAEVTDAIYQLLISQGDDVKLTKGCKTNLEGRRYWFTSTYFYAKDLNILTMINLISPDVVSGFFKLAKSTE